MEIKVLKKNEKSLLLEVKNESTAFVNLLREELWNDSSVVEAAYLKEHPYLAEPKILVTVSRGTPVNALIRATRRIEKKIKNLEEEFKKSL